MTAMAMPRHRVSAATAQMRSVAASVADAPVWCMGAEEARATLVELTRLKAQIASLELRVAAHGETVDDRDLTAAWAHTTNATAPTQRNRRFHRRM